MKISFAASSQAARRAILRTIIFPFSRVSRKLLSLFLSFCSYGKNDAIADTNKSIERVVPRTSAKSVRGKMLEEEPQGRTADP